MRPLRPTRTVQPNNIDAQSLTLAGNLGSSTISIAAGATGDQIASQVEAVSANTGVSLTARTTATFAVGAAGTLSFNIGSVSGSTSYSASVSVLVTDVSDLSSLADAINASSAASGVTATANGATLSLVNEEGRDIFVGDFANSTAGNQTATLTGASGAAVTLTEGSTDSSTVGATLSFTSYQAFSATTTSATGGIFTALTNSSALSSVASIDIGTQQGAQDALAVVDDASGHQHEHLVAERAAQPQYHQHLGWRRSLQRLSSGLRINSAKDDAAGLAIRTA
jgi:flagellin